MMWKKNTTQKDAHQSPLDDPALNDKMRYDGSHGSAALDTAQSPRDRNYPPPRPPRDDVPKRLPRLPSDTGASASIDEPKSKYRPASSIYSQPSPKLATTRFSKKSTFAMPATAYIDDVSPPSSPDIDTPYQQRLPGLSDDHEVSPIDESPNNSRLALAKPNSKSDSQKAPVTNIPVFRREKRRSQVAAATANLVTRKEVNAPKSKRTADVKWDPYSGEQTNSENGRPQSVKPGEFSTSTLRKAVNGPTGVTSENQSSVSAGSQNQQSFTDRVRNLKMSASERPEWRGASGRAAKVAPVADQAALPPISIPRKSSKRVGSPNPVHSETNTPATVRAHQGETSPASPNMLEHMNQSIKAVLSNSGRNSPAIVMSPAPYVADTSSSKTTYNNAQPRPVPYVEDNTPTPPYRTQSGENIAPPETAQLQKEESIGAIERNFREALKEVSFASNPSDPYVQPPSRFSVTTYAPSEAHGTPRLSTDTFDFPAYLTPQQAQIVDPQSASNNEHDLLKISEGPKATARKAIPQIPSAVDDMTSTRMPVAEKRVSNLLKSLPQSPAEVQSLDLIGSLQAQLDDLAHRRNNILRSIKQITELMPTDGVTVTTEIRKKRENEKMKIENLREEEADVRRQEHDLGLKLHRAYKRKDKDSSYEPTGLWVRRVTE